MHRDSFFKNGVGRYRIGIAATTTIGVHGQAPPPCSSGLSTPRRAAGHIPSRGRTQPGLGVRLVRRRGSDHQPAGQATTGYDVRGSAAATRKFSQLAASGRPTREDRRVPFTTHAVHFAGSRGERGAAKSIARYSNMESPVTGILTGISYVSGLDYFKGLNERYAAKKGKRLLVCAAAACAAVRPGCVPACCGARSTHGPSAVVGSPRCHRTPAS